MTSSFTGFSDEDLKRIKAGVSEVNNEPQIVTTNLKKINKIGVKPKNMNPQYKLQVKTDIGDAIDDIKFEKCKLSIKTPDILNNNIDDLPRDEKNNETELSDKESISWEEEIKSQESVEDRKTSVDSIPDVSELKTNYTENELKAHKAKLEDLQLRQKLMEEQNKKRKEMLAKALADRTKQTEEEVLKLEKIKKELQILDGQFSQDVSVLRKKIDQACLTYAEAEKTYLKVEKEFLQAKINLQKEKEKKELLTEHLCALITHNESRKAKKLETLMLQLAYDVKNDELMNCDQGITDDMKNTQAIDANDNKSNDLEEKPVVVDGVDEKTGKFIDINLN